MVMILFFVAHGMTISSSSSSSSSNSRRGMSIVGFGRWIDMVIAWSTRITVSMSSTLIVPVIDRVVHVWIGRVVAMSNYDLTLNSLFVLVMVARR